ncbi:hypothetical protein ACE1B6_13305 [Aerosakkonemataceae cyanobacterium BLCC-F154]|uniref:Uncharacterized protein n=1 Tax=Floridaenema fluviatile BLCC-F154 TaxID=3153640 RepID=A0ABV4YDG4_9CYAN
MAFWYIISILGIIDGKVKYNFTIGDRTKKRLKSMGFSAAKKFMKINHEVRYNRVLFILNY